MEQDLMQPEAFLDHLSEMFATHGQSADTGSRMSNAAHMLQAAAAAKAEGAGDHLIAACLLHDIGHWLDEGPGDAMAQGRDDRHEEVARDYLAPYFDDAVLAPIALHVAAKRYLCAVEPEYLNALSRGSTRTLEIQGGPMNTTEVEAFEAEPGYDDAVALRRWDEYGKEPGRDVPDFDSYREILRGQMKG